MRTSLTIKFWQILLRTQVQLVGSVVLALGVFLIEFSSPIIQYLESGSQIRIGVTGDTLSYNILEILRRLSTFPHAKDIVTALIFAGTGGALYFGFIFLSNVIISIRNEIVVDVNTTGSVTKVLAARVSAKLLAASWFALLCVASIFWIVPYWMDMFRIFVYSGLQPKDTGFLLIGFFGLALNIYIVWAAAYFTWLYEESI